jgi:Pyruvate/2-oxoacid:ferredoxin oxidoreductase delta subunit
MRHDKAAISIKPEVCTLCRNCQLICSFTNTGVFNPFAAHIQIAGFEETVNIVFLDTCKGCGLCAQFCVYGALHKEESHP